MQPDLFSNAADGQQCRCQVTGCEISNYPGYRGPEKQIGGP